jgi:hypothetical protein
MMTAHDIVQSPAWFPLEVNGDTLRWVRLDEAAYQAASFLDQRLLNGRYEQATCGGELFRSTGAQLPIRAHYIFHTGHVGSTLVARLIGAHRSFFSVREPALLRALLGYRQLPNGAADLHAVRALLSRTWRAEQRPVIKATSFVSELAETLLTGGAASSGGRTRGSKPECSHRTGCSDWPVDSVKAHGARTPLPRASTSP